MTWQRVRRPLLAVVGLAMLLGFLFPIYWMIATSFKGAGSDALVYPPELIPTSLNLKAWNRIINESELIRYVLNSTIIATGTTALSLTLAAPAAYAVTHLELRGKSMFMLANLSALMFPTIMLATPLYVIFLRLGLTDSYLALILANATVAMPFSIILLRPFFAGIPRELVEAAMIDGCGQFGAFGRIVLPVALPGLATAGIFAFLISWGDLVFALTLIQDDALRPVTAGLWQFLGVQTADWPAAMAFSTMAMLPPLLLFIIAQRYVVAGLTAGSIKG